MQIPTLLMVLFVASVTCYTEQEYQASFTSWMHRHKKSYSSNEFQQRYEIFKNNMDYVQEWNSKNSTAILGLNVMADLSNMEYKRLKGASRITRMPSVFENVETKRASLPASVDWRQSGAVTPVKNQAQCGSDYAFSAVGAIEGAHKIKTGQLVSLSEQQIVDCSGANGNDGCDGGQIDSSFQYVIASQGLQTELSYPYDGVALECRFLGMFVGATISSFRDVASGDESALQQAVATVGPVAAGIDGDNFSFQLYVGGIYNEPACSSSEISNGVLVVGYGTENGNDYWLVKNSFGVDWGESGYIRMSRNKNNQCGIATMASYPIV